MHRLSLLPAAWLLALSLASAAELRLAARDAKGLPVADAVVSLLPLDSPAPTGSITCEAAVQQQGQEFSPFVTVVQTGTAVKFPNRDTVQHHVYSLSKARKFELPLYNPGRAEVIVFDQPGLITLGCNIHDWMLAYVVVVATPWFAQTDAAGTATVTAPPGRYRLELWHPRLAALLTSEITLTAGEAPPLPFTLTLKPDRRIHRPADAKPGAYR